MVSSTVPRANSKAGRLGVQYSVCCADDNILSVASHEDFLFVEGWLLGGLGQFRYPCDRCRVSV